MQITKGIKTIELVINLMGKCSVIHPTLIWNDTEAILVDTGVPGQFPMIKEAIENSGTAFNKLTKVILTHQDIDHVGSLREILEAVNYKIEVLAHEKEKPYIEGKKPPYKMTPERLAKMTESFPMEKRILFKTYLTSHYTVDKVINDEEFLPYCGGITVIFTPGHTPGHISLYHHHSKALITGDALVAANGVLKGPNPQVTPDMDTAFQSIKKFTNYDIETVICYHGGVIRKNVNEQIRKLANSNK